MNTLSFKTELEVPTDPPELVLRKTILAQVKEIRRQFQILLQAGPGLDFENAFEHLSSLLKQASLDVKLLNVDNESSLRGIMKNACIKRLVAAYERAKKAACKSRWRKANRELRIMKSSRTLGHIAMADLAGVIDIKKYRRFVAQVKFHILQEQVQSTFHDLIFPMGIGILMMMAYLITHIGGNQYRSKPDQE